MTFSKYDVMRKRYMEQRQVVVGAVGKLNSAIDAEEFALAELYCDVLKTQLESMDKIVETLTDIERGKDAS